MQVTNSNYEIAEIGRTGQRQLILKGKWHSGMADIMRAGNVRALLVSGYTGWNEPDLHFLHDVPFLERLSLLVLNRVNIDGIYLLPNLKDLSVGYNKRPIDFGRLRRLQRVALGWCKGYESLFECRSLRDIAISRFPEDHLPALSRFSNLESLALSNCTFTDLRRYPELPQLVRLSLIVCNRLENLLGLEHCSNLLVLWIEQAKVLNDIAAVAHLQALKTLVLRDCPRINSIKAVTGLPNLEAVSLSAKTNIRDGDLSPLTSLPRLTNASYKDRPHYSIKSEWFPKQVPIFL